MKNMFRRKNSNDGFTLAEVLATVAIILILAGVTFVSVVQYQKNLRLMEMDGTAKEIFVAAQNHLSLAQSSGDLDRLATASTGTGTATDAAYGTKLGTAPSYAGDANGQYYYVIHNAAQGAGNETYIPANATSVYDLMLPFGALDGTVQQGGNYAIVYERKSASVVAVLYSGAGNASFGNASTIQMDGDDVQNIEAKKLYSDSSARKAYEKNGTTVVVGCYTGKAGSNANLDVKTLEAPKLVVKNEAKLHAIVSGNYTKDEQITLYIKGMQSGALASRVEDCKDGDNSFDITIDDITGDGSMRFTNLCGTSAGKQRFTHDDSTPQFTIGENIEVYATVSAKDALATPKNSETVTVSSLFGEKNSDKDAKGYTTVSIMNLRHLENLGPNISEFAPDKLGGKITAEQKRNITMFTNTDFGMLNGLNIFKMNTEKTYAAANINYALKYNGNYKEISGLHISAQTGETAAGIFGVIACSDSKNIPTIRNLFLRNNQVSGATNAGMLVGEASQSIKVLNVLAAYHAGLFTAENPGDYNEEDDSNTYVKASGAAGGLIGLASNGQLDVQASAASVYVEGGTAAGGFIGSVTDSIDSKSKIKNSYVGGHTKEGKYSTETTGSGRYNVQVTEASGTAGGFIGVSHTKLTVQNVYTTASAYSKDTTKSGSFCGSGIETVKIAGMNNSDKTPSYYAIGPHNGVAASAEDTAKMNSFNNNQGKQQAIAYDRTLLGATEANKHDAMDKTTYPMATIRHLCAWTDEADLPWFIKEHIGDWVEPGNADANFEVDNGNRLTVRINTGLDEINNDLYYQVKVHGETERFNDAYFLLHVKNDNSVDVQVKFNNGDWKSYNHNIAVCTSAQDSTKKVVELYLDDITNQYGNFATIFDGNLFYPGEDISINVAPMKSENDQNVTYDDEKKVYTNSLYGYLQNKDKDPSTHNQQKIAAVRNYFSQAGEEKNGLGLMAKDNGYYVQIDNARHLENLAYAVGYPWPSELGNKVVGAIQTDNIYWSGNSDAFTKGFQEELGTGLNVWSRDGKRTSDGNFYPIDYNANLSSYDGSNYKISGLCINENGAAGLFLQTHRETSFSNMKIENSTMVSTNGKVGGLVAFGDQPAHITNVHFKGELSIKAKEATGGLIGQLNSSIDIKNSGIEGDAIIQSTDGQAGGLVGDAGGTTTIDKAIITGNEKGDNSKLIVKGKGQTGGFIGTKESSSITISVSKIDCDATIQSTSDAAGGLIGCTKGTTTIDNVQLTGKTNGNASKLVVDGKEKTGGFIGDGQATITVTNSKIDCDATIQSTSDAAGGLVAAAKDITATNVKIRGENSEIIASKNAGGLIGHIDSGIITISNVGVSAFVGSSSTEEHAGAGGLIGYIGAPGADSTISKSYYGGRTVDGAYACNIVNESTPYDANINGKRSTGGFIGYIGNGNGLAISQCFSTGSVDTQASPNTNDAYAGGFIGSGVNWQGSMSITQCYSMGKVTGTNAQTGGFIGKLNNITLTNAYYYCAFNNGQNARGDSPSNTGFTVLTTPSVNDILADENVDEKGESSYTAKENTHTYDHPTLQDKTYPYKNWTTEDSEGTMVNTYYGDWSIIYKQMNSRLVYYHKNTWDDKTRSGSVTLTGYDTSLTTDLTNPKGNIESDGFGIICETTKRENVHKKFKYSTSLNGTYQELPVEGSDDETKCATFQYNGKTYIFFRITTGALDVKQLKNTTIYIRGTDDSIYKDIRYKVYIGDGTAKFELITE